MSMRVVTLSHGHPSLSPGGAEVAAQALHQALSVQEDIECLHIACAPDAHPWLELASGDTRFVPPAPLDPVRLFATDPAGNARLLDMIGSFGPDIIHLHHVLGFGVDLVFALRQRFPAAAILLTLHEFIAICHNQGQMMRPDGSLCERATPADCSACFPSIPTARFLRREHALRAMLGLVDAFVAPSTFLAQRYADWGIPPSRIVRIENVVPAAAIATPEVDRTKRGRFAYFGQITPFKGLDVLLQAVASLSDTEWGENSLTIHGANLERQPQAFQERIRDLLKLAAGRVRMAGSYRNSDLPSLMAAADWIVVPSIWWENSPLVIQEAFSNGRPVIASNIGGMAEKVVHGQNGLTFSAGDINALAHALRYAGSPKIWQKMRLGVVPPAAPEVIAHWHRRLYETVLKGRQSTPQVA